MRWPAPTGPRHAQKPCRGTGLCGRAGGLKNFPFEAGARVICHQVFERRSLGVAGAVGAGLRQPYDSLWLAGAHLEAGSGPDGEMAAIWGDGRIVAACAGRRLRVNRDRRNWGEVCERPKDIVPAPDWKVGGQMAGCINRLSL